MQKMTGSVGQQTVTGGRLTVPDGQGSIRRTLPMLSPDYRQHDSTDQGYIISSYNVGLTPKVRHPWKKT